MTCVKCRDGEGDLELTDALGELAELLGEEEVETSIYVFWLSPTRFSSSKDGGITR